MLSLLSVAFALDFAFLRLAYSSTDTPAIAARMIHNQFHVEGASSEIGAAALAVSSSAMVVVSFAGDFSGDVSLF